MKHVRFVSVAEEEMNLAAVYYEEKAKHLGLDFLIETLRVTKNISANPQLGIKVRGEIRRRILNRFPYAVLYTIDADEIVILAVMHQRREPDYWIKR